MCNRNGDVEFKFISALPTNELDNECHSCCVIALCADNAFTYGYGGRLLRVVGAQMDENRMATTSRICGVLSQFNYFFEAITTKLDC